jgi:hypothetical protein
MVEVGNPDFSRGSVTSTSRCKQMLLVGNPFRDQALEIYLIGLRPIFAHTKSKSFATTPSTTIAKPATRSRTETATTCRSTPHQAIDSRWEQR